MREQFDFSEPVVWRPNLQQREQAHLTAFMRQHGIASFDELMRRSTEDVAWFTDAVLKYLDIQFYEPYRQVVDVSEGIQFPRWCAGGKMNIVHNCVDKYPSTAVSHQFAVIWEGEEGEVRRLTYRELYEEVNRCANALRWLGLGKGDVVGLYLPMTPEIVVALLATAKIGGIILPLFSGYGAGAVISRMNDAGAKALVTSDGAYRRGKAVEMKASADEAAAHIPTLKHILVTRRTGQAVSMTPGRDHWWDDLMAQQATQAETERTDAEDVLMLIYTSGTTGKPKGAVHTHCGFPVKAAQDMAFGMDTHAGDVFYWMTDMGWMMGPWLVFGALLLGGTVFLYDGAPDFPAPDRLWQLVERHNIHQLGVSPTLIRSLVPHGNLFEKYDLSSLKCFASSGEPWNPAPWMWLFEQVGKARIPIINYSGGTEISGGIVSGNPLLPLKPCSFAGPCPGMAADVFDENGQPVRNAVGELVIKAPWIGMTRGFWNDRQRYLETYWGRWENIWVHGDFAAIDEDGLWYILGRSDDTIKVAGKRLGPAEVESILVKHPQVVEAAAIGVPHEVKGSELVLFVVLKADKAEKRMETAEEAEKRMETTDEAEKRMKAAEEAEKRMKAADEAEKRMETTDEAEKRMETTDEAEKRMKAAEEAEKQMETTDEAEKRMETTDEAEKRMETTEETEKRMKAAEEAEKRMETAEEAEKRMETVEEAEKRMKAAEEAEKRMKAAEEAEKRIETTEEAEKRMERIRGELREMVIAEMGKALAPKAILFVKDLPKTRNAKVMRRMIRAAYLGQEPGDTSSLVNPEAVDEIRRGR